MRSVRARSDQLLGAVSREKGSSTREMYRILWAEVLLINIGVSYIVDTAAGRPLLDEYSHRLLSCADIIRPRHGSVITSDINLHPIHTTLFHLYLIFSNQYTAFL